VVRLQKGVPLHAAWAIDGIVSIGRGAENRIDLVDPRVSRRHARITKSDDGVALQDLGSTNGTSVNGAEVRAPVPLGPGDVIQVGDTQLRVEIGDG
ncbi:MAG: FHA domain-containing protein, partial [Polyangiaceae bacterium]